MFEIEIDGFSGPLDLLCHLIEQNEIEAAHISVSEVIAIYTSYLAKNASLPISSIADFISQAAHLVRQKTFSLLPRYVQNDETFQEEILIDDDIPVADMIERYRPYREAASLLSELKMRADRRHFRRGEDFDPFFDLGDLYSLAMQWLDLLNQRSHRNFEIDDDDSWQDDGLPAEIPDEVQVENRMERILERLEIAKILSLRSLLKEEPGRASLVVSLLALLELSRRNKVTLTQKELFGDVRIAAR